MSQNKQSLNTTSPCIGICSTTFGDDICYGCKRTYKEVIEWNSMSDEDKDQVNQRLAKLDETTCEHE